MKKSNLKIEYDQALNLIAVGEGERVAYVFGAVGSFYLDQFPSNLYNEYTFYARAQTDWVYRKEPCITGKEINCITQETLIADDHVAVTALREKLKKPICGFGFSAPGSLIFKHALKHPNDFEEIVGTGVAFIKLDATFSKSNSIFQANAEDQRKAAFNRHHEKFMKFMEGVKLSEDGLTFSVSGESRDLMSFFGLNPEKLSQKGHHLFLAETEFNKAKVMKRYNDDNCDLNIYSHWKKNLLEFHVNRQVQRHFFESIASDEDFEPLVWLLDLAKKRKVHLIFGKYDCITPIDSDIRSRLKSSLNTSFVEIEGGHMPYVECPDEYSEIIRSFFPRIQNISENEFSETPVLKL